MNNTEDPLVDALARARRILRAGCLPPGGLSNVHLLAILANRPDGIVMSEIASLMGFAEAASTQLGDALENKGLAERRRDPNDRRKVRLHLTEAGRLALMA